MELVGVTRLCAVGDGVDGAVDIRLHFICLFIAIRDNYKQEREGIPFVIHISRYRPGRQKPATWWKVINTTRLYSTFGWTGDDGDRKSCNVTHFCFCVTLILLSSTDYCHKCHGKAH